MSILAGKNIRGDSLLMRMILTSSYDTGTTLKAVLRILMFLGLLDPDPSIIKQNQ
jgi:hypothetical protein